MLSRLNRNRYILVIDTLFIIIAAPLAFLIRLDASPSFIRFTSVMVLFAGVGLVVKPFLYWAFGLYRQFWRYASINELRLIVITVSVTSLTLTVLFIVILLPYNLINTFPRSVLVIDWLLQLIFVGGIRLLVRVSAEGAGSGNAENSLSTKRVLVVGAGDAGSMMVREMQHNPGMNMLPIVFVDDDPAKAGKRIHNVPVLGNLDDIESLSKQWYIQEVIIAMPTAPGRVVRQVAQTCEKTGIPSKIIPGMYELIGGQVSVNQLRTVQIEDLLRREPVQTDVSAVAELLRNKRILITGGGGSIGSELCRQVLRCEPAELVIVGHGENSIFEIHNELQLMMSKMGLARQTKLRTAIADIRFADRLAAIFDEHRPNIVFHAAAHKHVPLMEANPVEAITNNVLGTRNLLDIAQTTGVEQFVMISTDKAVNPTSIMGASKRAAELLVHQTARLTGQPYVAVRFGNVLGSRGSVVNTFKQQIAAGGPITITHPEMQRYFMSIPEAVQLVLQAAVLGRGGEVFMLDMGRPVKIVDLARDLIKLSGLEVGRDIDIIFTGARPGEKLFEELFIAGEQYRPTAHKKIFIASHNDAPPPEHFKKTFAQLEIAALQNDTSAIFQILQELVTEFTPFDAQASTSNITKPVSPEVQ